MVARGRDGNGVIDFDEWYRGIRQPLSEFRRTVSLVDLPTFVLCMSTLLRHPMALHDLPPAGPKGFREDGL